MRRGVPRPGRRSATGRRWCLARWCPRRPRSCRPLNGWGGEGPRMAGEHATATTVRLGDLAHARGGDKGNRATTGVVANDAGFYAWLRESLTPSLVAEYFRPLGVGEVRRYEL